MKNIYLILFFVIMSFQSYAQGTLQNVFEGSERFRTFVSLLRKSGYAEMLKMKGPFTVFAPTDDAFLQLPQGIVATMINAKTQDEKMELYNFVKHYIFEGSYTLNDLKKMTSLKNIAGDEVKIEGDFYGVKVNGIVIIQGDIKANNGWAHSMGKCFYKPE